MSVLLTINKLLSKYRPAIYEDVSKLTILYNLDKSYKALISVLTFKILNVFKDEIKEFIHSDSSYYAVRRMGGKYNDLESD